MAGIEVATGELNGGNIVRDITCSVNLKGVDLTKPQEVRELILYAQEEMAKHPEAIFGDSEVCPLTHHYTPGLYSREIYIPAGMLIIGKIHKHEHPNMLVKGHVSVLTEQGGVQLLQGPKFMISPAGTKRMLYTHTETVWITFHSNKNNLEFGDELEDEIVAKSYEEFERFLEIN